MEKILLLTPILALAALLFAAYKARFVAKAAPGNSRMQEIAASIAEGADAFLRSEYKILAIFIIILFVLIAIFIGIGTAVCFVLGALCSILAGFFGMKVATKANVRTANAAMEHGMNRALSIAFSGGSVMGMCVVGLGLLGCSLIYIVTGNYNILFGFSLGASSIALFARVGGGIYTKAADVGADLVGKVEAGIPEDDPRNPAVIADNVGDNVGDVAGMGADLFESYVGALVSALTLGVSVVGLFEGAGAIFPLTMAAVGIFASIVATFFVRGKDGSNPHKALKMGSYISALIVAVVSIPLSQLFFGRLFYSAPIIAGIVVGLVIGFMTEVYTSEDYRSVKRIASQSETGSATTIISGVAVGMKSTWVPIVLICIGIYISYTVTGGLYGIALAAVGMLSTTGITVAVDAYGPIADNSGGIAEMSGLDPHVREITDKLDAVGNTTAAMGKGFAIGSAAFATVSLIVAYVSTYSDAVSPDLNFAKFVVVAGGIIGGALVEYFSALLTDNTIESARIMADVGDAELSKPGVLEGTVKPDYDKCIQLAAKQALKKMLLPSVLALLIPIIGGFIFGVEFVGGLLVGATIVAIPRAIFMGNSGGAFDNAKKYIESGALEGNGKGTAAHKASVTGDTVGDTRKDVVGVALDIFIKTMSTVANTLAVVIKQISLFK